MIILDNLKKAWNIILHPNSVSEPMNISAGMKFYYTVAILPLLALILLNLVFPSVRGPLSYGIGAVLIEIVLMFVAVPISIFINAVLYHFFSKILLKIWPKTFDNTFTATLYSALPVTLFFWLNAIPILNNLLFLFGIWGLIVLVISISRLHGVSGIKALLGILIPLIIVGAIFFVVALLFAVGAFNPSPVAVSSACIPEAGFLCNIIALHNGVLSLQIGQVTGTLRSFTLCFVPTGGIAPTNSSCPSTDVAGEGPTTLAPDQLATFNFSLYPNVISSTSPGASAMGTIWAIYIDPTTNNYTDTQIATVTATQK